MKTSNIKTLMPVLKQGDVRKHRCIKVVKNLIYGLRPAFRREDFDRFGHKDEHPASLPLVCNQQ